MRQLVGNYGNYSFNPAAKTITIAGITETLRLENVLGITNVTDNIMIYVPNSPLKGAVSIINNVITLVYDTTTMSSSDNLQIMIDVPDKDAELIKVLYQLNRKLESLSHIDPLTAAVKVSVANAGGLPVTGTLTAVTSITNAVTVATLNALNGVDPRFLLQDQSIQAFASSIRSRYTFT